jgi:hypothetical protein
MERYTAIPTLAANLETLADQMLLAIADYAEFDEDLLTAKNAAVTAGIADVAGKQVTNDDKSALYISARNVYYAARDVLALAKDSLADGVNSLRSHIQTVLAIVTDGMTAEQFAQLETDCGLALTVPLVFLAPVAPVLTLAKWINVTDALLNWAASVADNAGHCAASAYMVEKSANGTTYTYEKVVTTTEVYVTVGSNTHYRIVPFGDAGQGAPLSVLVSAFTPAS